MCTLNVSVADSCVFERAGSPLAHVPTETRPSAQGTMPLRALHPKHGITVDRDVEFVIP